MSKSHGTQVAKTPLNDETLEIVENFSYLGSIISNNFTLDKELNTQVGKAATLVGRLSKRVWPNKSLTLHTKLKVYHACVFSILLYGAEIWTTYHKQELKLNSFHLRCLRTILYQPGNPAMLQLKSTKQRSKTETATLAWSRTPYAH